MSRETLHSQDDYLLPEHWLLPKENIWTIMHHAYVKRVVEIVVRIGAKSLLEVGCGDGWNCAQFVKAGINTTGVDLSVNGIQHASRMVTKAKFFCCDVRDEQFRSAFPELFDAVVFIEVIEHIPPDDCVEALQNIASYVKPGGVLVLTTPSTNIPNNNPHHYRHFTEPILRDLVSQAGNLEVELIEGYGNAAAETHYYRWARWVDNRYYTVYPLRRWMQNRYSQECISTPIQQCHGFILVLRRLL